MIFLATTLYEVLFLWYLLRIVRNSEAVQRWHDGHCAETESQTTPQRWTYPELNTKYQKSLIDPAFIRDFCIVQRYTRNNVRR